MPVSKIFKKFKDIYQGQKMWPLLNNNSVFIQACGWNTAKYYDLYYRDRSAFSNIIIMKKGDNLQISPSDKPLELAVEVFEDYLKNPNSLSERLMIFEQFSSLIRNAYYNLTYKFVDENNLEYLLKRYKEIHDPMCCLNAVAWFSIYFDKEFCYQLLQSNKVNLNRVDFEIVWDTASIQPVESFDTEQLREFLKLVINRRSWKEIVESCQYFFASYYDIKNLSLVESILNEKYGQFKNPDSAKVKLKEINDEFRLKLNTYNNWKNKLNSTQLSLAEYLRVIMVIRDKRKNILFQGYTILWRIAQKMFKQVGISDDLIPFYTYNEMLGGIKYLKSVKKDLIKRRSGFILSVDYNGKIEFELCNFEDNKKAFKKYYLTSIGATNKVNEIEGQIGFPGKVTARVRLVLSPSKIKNFNFGDILVTGMTRPEYLFLMKKAGAIVTDEGGITCHATIVARELKIPCIIGTKIATQVLKNRDLVEVDANKGTVKILELAHKS